ncbi:LuxR family two component transcriptional regulator [Orenia metallireducens]|uniref:Stage 0 sporulation protein A homolog n=1 Tax=Orenia metallireducens TaxID=1413210 RepID=A0A285HWN2_9FIRM|nr:response regulator transcription factor [Orenia metallireducens]PRX29357.1 LuxR family two component transcriptional regulator [Orenia metallireducens]SNY40120.1 two component transcriptional regulator, LuxR family [Orenia metallireducens]
MINTIVVDDQKIVRDGLKMILSLDDQINILGEAGNGKELMEIVPEMMPDVILMDIRMPIMDGVETTKAIKEKYPDIKIIILTTFNEDEFIFKGLKNGANGYILKDSDSDILINAIKTAYKGNILLNPEVTKKIVNVLNNNLNQNKDLENDEKLKLLTTRELDVAKLVADGKSNKSICEELFLTEGTVKNYVTKILDKLELDNRTELAIYINQIK